jgi:hypothetical protein
MLFSRTKLPNTIIETQIFFSTKLDDHINFISFFKFTFFESNVHTCEKVDYKKTQSVKDCSILATSNFCMWKHNFLIFIWKKNYHKISRRNVRVFSIGGFEGVVREFKKKTKTHYGALLKSLKMNQKKLLKAKDLN